MQKPSVGRIVHYQSYGTPNGEYKPLPRAAIITEVIIPQTNVEPAPIESVGLCIMNPTGLFFTQGVKFSEEPKPGHWSWPPKV
jgi:hypothetical protein